jgi:PAS domain S-box-containing protein
MTESEPAEGMPNESDQRIRSLVEKTGVGVATIDLTGAFTFVNGALTKLLGYSVGELCGRRFEEFLHPDDIENVTKLFLKAISSPIESETIEFRVMRRDGRVLHLMSKPTRYTIDGRTAGFQAIILDISERKQAQDALWESQENFEALAENAFDGILVGTQEGVHVYANKRAAEITGYSVAELLRTTIKDLVHPDEFEKLSERYRRRLEGRAVPNPGETVIIRKDGRSLPIELAGARTIWQRKPADMVFFRDIAERMRMEEEIRSLARFPSENPNPLLRLDRHGTVLAANEASKVLLQDWGSGIGQVAPKTWRDMAADALSSGQSRNIDVEFSGKSYTFLVKPILEGGYVNLYGRDITERKRAEEALWLSEAKLRALIDNATDFIFSIGEKYEVIAMNPAAARLLGKTVEQVLGKSIFDVYPKEIATMFSENVRAVLQTGKSKSIDEKVVVAGNELWINTRLEPLLDDKSRVYAVTGVARDITERKRLEDEIQRYSAHLEQLVFERTKKLAESERRFRELSDLLPQIVFEIDKNGNVQYMNRAAFAAIGLGEEDFCKGLNAFQMFAQEDHERAMQGIQRTLTGETIGGREFTALRRDGTTFPALVYTAPVMREGKTVGIRGIAIDITERKRAEEEILAAGKRLEYLITSNPAVIFTSKPRADRSDYDVTYMSNRVVEMLGFKSEELIGHPEFWDGRVHPDDLRHYLAEVPRLWKDGQRTFEYRFLHEDGTYRWIREETKVIRDAAGKPVEVMGYWTDVTERKRMEERLVTSKRMATIGELAAMVGHDLRNPLTGISTATYNLRTHLGRRIDTETREALGQERQPLPSNIY